MGHSFISSWVGFDGERRLQNSSKSPKNRIFVLHKAQINSEL
jgi:hypothetical protein